MAAFVVLGVVYSIVTRWYVLAATDDPDVNARVAAAAEARHTFCVRADRGEAGSAWTPATATVPGATIAVQATHDPSVPAPCGIASSNCWRKPVSDAPPAASSSSAAAPATPTC